MRRFLWASFFLLSLMFVTQGLFLSIGMAKQSLFQDPYFRRMGLFVVAFILMACFDRAMWGVLRHIGYIVLGAAILLVGFGDVGLERLIEQEADSIWGATAAMVGLLNWPWSNVDILLLYGVGVVTLYLNAWWEHRRLAKEHA